MSIKNVIILGSCEDIMYDYMYEVLEGMGIRNILSVNHMMIFLWVKILMRVTRFECHLDDYSSKRTGVKVIVPNEGIVWGRCHKMLISYTSMIRTIRSQDKPRRWGIENLVMMMRNQSNI